MSARIYQRLMRSARLIVVLLLAAAPARPSIFIASTVTDDASVRVIGTNGAGTGTIIGNAPVPGFSNFVTLCILTAGHVLADNPITQIGIGSQQGIVAGGDVPRNDTPGFEVMPTWLTENIGGATGKEDLGFLAVTVDFSTLSPANRARLLALPIVQMGVGGFNVFTASSYGDSARAATAGERTTFGQPAGTYTHHFPNPADEQYGIERSWTNQISVFNTTYTDGTYTYDAAEFFFKPRSRNLWVVWPTF